MFSWSTESLPGLRQLVEGLYFEEEATLQKCGATSTLLKVRLTYIAPNTGLLHGLPKFPSQTLSYPVDQILVKSATKS